MMVVVMGVSGAGKTTVGNALAESLGWEFLDADEFHPESNVAKMAAGTPLTDADRWPWLDRLNAELRGRDANGSNAVLACSALKDAYRARLMANLRAVRLVFLRGNFESIRARMQARKHKYMPASLLQSQFDTLEPPVNALEVDATLDIPAAVERIAEDLATRGPPRTP
jgi:gluconokinase